MAIIIGGTILIPAVFLLVNSRPPADIPGVEKFTGLIQRHTTQPVNYPQTPPVGGEHNPAWQNCGIYDQPIQDENAVHSLEHGAMWVTYRPDLPADAVETLRSLVRGRTFALLTPYPELPAPIVATVWGAQLRVDDPGDPRLAQFMVNYMQGPLTPELGAPCDGGLGVPLDR